MSQLDPGPYTIAVSDLSEEHNFHLFGPGVNEATQVETTGKVTWTVNLVEGRYTLVCDPHATSMRQEFVVGNPPPLPQPGPSPVPTVPKLLATVGPKNTISLRNAAGTLLKTVKAGTYSIVVRDRSKVHNFHLVGKGVNRKTAGRDDGDRHLEAAAAGRRAPLLLRPRAEDGQGLRHRSLAGRSSSAFSSAPKSSANAE